MSPSKKRITAHLLLGLVAINVWAGPPESDDSQTRLPWKFHAAFCGEPNNALQDETGTHELSQAYSTALLIDLQHREKTQARSTRDALADMRVEYCPGRRDGQ